MKTFHLEYTETARHTNTHNIKMKV